MTGPAKNTMSYPTCENCHKNVATVTVIEIPPKASGEGPGSHRQQLLCEICAQSKNLPHAPVVNKTLSDIWKLLQASGQGSQPEPELACPDCGMTQEELRARGRIGCPRDYEIFSEDIGETLERVHGAVRHEGRVPGVSPDELNRMQAISTLKRKLTEVIREEDYESAARIRDELQALGEGA